MPLTEKDVIASRRRPRPYGARPSSCYHTTGMKTLTPLEAKDLQDAGHLLIDVRSFQEFDSAHPAGALSVEYSRRSFDERVSQVAGAPASLILVVDGDLQSSDDLRAHLEAKGYSVSGSVSFADWAASGLPTRALKEISVTDLAGHADSGGPILDIREPIEIEFLGAFPGAYEVPLSEALGRRVEIEGAFGPDSDLVILCSAGLRSATAGSLLFTWGYTRLAHPPDGLNGWLHAGHDLVRGR